jgi:hypothetical protein
MSRRNPRFPIVLPVAFAGLLLTVSVVGLTPAVVDARTKAERAVCTNDFFQHSGCHRADTVWLDRDLRVIEVGSCPLCCPSAGGPVLGAEFYIAGQESEPMSWLSVPEATRLEAKYRLDQYKLSEWFRGRHDRFLGPRRQPAPGSRL